MELNNDNIFIMISGIPGAGKTRTALTILNELEQSEKVFKNSKDLLPVSKISADMAIDINKNEINQAIEAGFIKQNEKCITYISANDTRKELSSFGILSDDFPFAIIDARIATALKNNISVIYDASNLDEKTREKYLNIAHKAKVSKTELVLCHSSVENASKSHQNIRRDMLEKMDERFKQANKHIDKRWDIVKNINDKEIDKDFQIEDEYDLDY